MSEIIDGGCTNSDLILNVRKKTIRFKAGADVSSSVNKMDVNVFEDKDEKFETLEVQIKLTNQVCSENRVQL
ncbi:MAG: hypothetical protein RL308_384 [Bacteroidota bacterium]|jgi:hypothetical protein